MPHIHKQKTLRSNNSDSEIIKEQGISRDFFT
jgi:hypothetical protein